MGRPAAEDPRIFDLPRVIDQERLRARGLEVETRPERRYQRRWPGSRQVDEVRPDYHGVGLLQVATHAHDRIGTRGLGLMFPAHTVHALCDPALATAVATVLVAETGALGLRGTVLQRWPQHRTETSVDVDGHPVRVKVAEGRVKPEHDDAVAAAAALGVPLRDVLARAEAAARAALDSAS